jgi:hypothetical protein
MRDYYSSAGRNPAQITTDEARIWLELIGSNPCSILVVPCLNTSWRASIRVLAHIGTMNLSRLVGRRVPRRRFLIVDCCRARKSPGAGEPQTETARKNSVGIQSHPKKARKKSYGVGSIFMINRIEFKDLVICFECVLTNGVTPSTN